MKKVMIYAVALSISSIVCAQPIPDLRGTWTGIGNATVLGAGQHHPGDEPIKLVRFHHVSFQYIIEQQEGPNFSGKVVSPNFEELLAGAISQDGKSGVMADIDGSYIFKILGKNKMEACYTHTKPASIVASCNVIERK
jgi:hypothetical protein